LLFLLFLWGRRAGHLGGLRRSWCGGRLGRGVHGLLGGALGSAASERTSRAEAQRDGIVRGQPDEGRAITDWPASILGLHPRPLETPFEPKPPSS